MSTPKQLPGATERRSKQAGGLILLYAAFVSCTPEFDIMGIPKVRLTDLMIPFLFVTITKVRLKQGHRVPLQSAMSVMLMWNVVCLGLSGVPLMPGLSYIAKRAVYLLIYRFGFSVARTTQDWSRVPMAMIGASLLLSFTVTAQQDAGAGRASGIIANQEQSTCYFMILILGLLWGAAKAFPNQAPVVALVGLVSTKTMLATGTRGGMILLVIMAALASLQNLRRALPSLVVIAVILALGWSFTPDDIRNRLSTVGEESEVALAFTSEGTEAIASHTGGSSVAARLVSASRLVDFVIPQSPIWGMGPGFRKLGFVDNMFMTELAYGGLVGLVLWGRIHFGLLSLTLRAQRYLLHPRERAFAFVMFAITVAFSVGCFTADIFYLIRPMEGYFLILGLVAGRYSEIVTTAGKKPVEKTPAPSPAKATVTGARLPRGKSR